METDVKLYKNTGIGFSINQGRLAFTMQIPEIGLGIDHMINQYGTLYYGNLLPTLFEDSDNNPVCTTKDKWIWKLLDIENWSDSDILFNSFTLELCREFLKTQWKWPALLNRMPDGSVAFNSGGSRALVSMLTTSDPWNHLPVLFYDKDGFSVDEVLKDYTVVDNVNKLHDIFHSGGDENLGPVANLTMTYKKIQNIFWPMLEKVAGCRPAYSSVIDRCDKEEFGLERSTRFLDNFRSWRKQYPSRPTLHVYTDWPESISDANSVWNIVHAGPSRPVIELIQGFGNRPAVLEKPCRQLHQDDSYNIAHTLYVIDDRKLDVGDFLLWMDLDHTTFVDENWKFIMYRKDQEFLSTFVKIGRPQ